MLMGRRGIPTLLAFLFAIGSFEASAQTADAAIHGLILNDAGAGLSAAEVVVTDLDAGYVYRTISAADGAFWIRNVQPGRYSIEASRLGMRTATLDEFRVEIGRSLRVDLTLAEAPIEVSGILVQVQPRSLTTGSGVSFMIDQAEIRRIPEESRRFIDLVQYTPGATGATENGSTGRFGAATPSVGALNSQSMGVVVDGADFTEPAFGELSGSIPMLAVQEFEVVQARYSAAYGRAAGGLVNVATRRGGNEFELQAFGLFRDRALTAIGTFEAEKPDFSRQHFGVAFSGPLSTDRTHFFVAFERRDENSFATVNTGGAFPDQEGTFLTPFNDDLLFMRIDHRPSDKHQFALRYSGEFGDRLSLQRRTGTPVSIDHGVNSSLQMNSINGTYRLEIDERTSNELRLNFIRRSLRNEKNAPNGPALVYPSLTRGPFFATTRYESTSIELSNDLTLIREAAGRHELTIGAQAALIDNSDIRVGIFDDGALLFTSDTASTPLVGQILVDKGIGLSARNTVLSAYVQDDWRVNDFLTLNLGLRWAVELSGTNQGYVSELAGQVPFLRTEPRGRDLNNFSPRLGFSYDFDGSKRTVLRGGFGIYHDALAAYPLLALERSSGSRTAVVFFPGTTDLRGLDIDPSTVPPDIWPVGDIDTPFTRQYSLGMQHFITDRLRASVDFVAVQGRNLLLERQLNTIDPNTRRPKYPTVGLIGQVLSKGTADARMMLVALEGDIGPGWFRLGYTLADRRNTNDVWNAFVPQVDPENEDFSGEEGPAAWDERHRLALTTGLTFADRVDLSLKTVYASARPYTALTGVDTNGDRDLAGFNDRPVGEGRNARRGPNSFAMDLGLRVRMPLAGFEGALVANVYNLTNRTNLRPESVVTVQSAPLFGQATDAFPKRQLEIGFEVGR